VEDEVLSAVRKEFVGGYCSDTDSHSEIARLWEKGYLMDTHTAVASRVLEDVRREEGKRTPCVIVSTASPFKFGGAVLEALGVVTDETGPALMDELTAFTGVGAPAPLAGLAGKELDIEAELSGLSGARQLNLKLFVGEDQQTLIRVDFESGHVFADYTGAHIPALRDKQTAFENNYYIVPERVKLRGYCYNAPFTPGDTLKFRVLCDRSTVEFFIPGTDVEFTFCVYPTQDAEGLSLCCDSSCTVEKLHVYEMESVWR